MSLEAEGHKSFLRKLFGGMMQTDKKAECLAFFERFLHKSPKQQTGLESVIAHIQSGKDLNDATIKQNILALLKSNLEHEKALHNLSCIVLMLVMSKEWDSIAASAGMKAGGGAEFLQAMMRNKFR